MSLPTYTADIMQRADKVAAKTGDLTAVYEELRELPLADYCQLIMTGGKGYKKLAKILPKLPSDDVQRKWVGDFGRTLMARSCNLARLFDLMAWEVTGSGLRGKKILDYGCGWGRLMQMMNYYSPTQRVHGVDPMQVSIDHCRKNLLPNKISLISTRPEAMPDPTEKYDFAFAFSVFSHTPKDVTTAVLKALRPSMSENSVFVVTIRSIEWLAVRDGAWPKDVVKKMRKSYETDGYGFQTFANADSLDEADYGDTIMSLEFFTALAKDAGWKVATVDRDMSEPFQIAVGLSPNV